MTNKHKNSFSLSEIIKGLQHAVSSASDILKAQQLETLSNYWDEQGKPLTKTVYIADRQVQIPLIALVPHGALVMETIEMKFNAEIGNFTHEFFKNPLTGTKQITHTDLLMNMSGVKADAQDKMEISIQFKIKDPTEGLLRLLDEYNKQI